MKDFGTMFSIGIVVGLLYYFFGWDILPLKVNYLIFLMIVSLVTFLLGFTSYARNLFKILLGSITIITSFMGINFWLDYPLGTKYNDVFNELRKDEYLGGFYQGCSNMELIICLGLFLLFILIVFLFLYIKLDKSRNVYQK